MRFRKWSSINFFDFIGLNVLLYLMRSIKDIRVLDMIDFNMFKDVESDYFMPHCILCTKNYLFFDNTMKELLAAKMKKHGILSLMFTMLNMWRGNLVTKEKVKEAYEQKLKNHVDWAGQNESIHDDLESFLFNIQNYQPIKEEDVKSYFTPKLTDEELVLVENKNEEYLQSFFMHGSKKDWSADVSVEEMKKSDSKDKFVHGYCLRRTFSIHEFDLENGLRSGFKGPNYNSFAARKRNWSDRR